MSVAAEILDSQVRYAALGRSHQVTKAEWLAGAGAAADEPKEGHKQRRTEGMLLARLHTATLSVGSMRCNAWPSI